MSIEKMLKYQETDMRLIKLENELKNSECAKKMISYQAATKKSFDTLTMFNDLAKSDMDQVRKVMSKFSDIVKQVEELMDESVEDCDEKQLDYCAKQIEKLNQSLEEFEREVVKINKELSDTSYKQGKEFEQAGKTSSAYRKNAEEFNALKQSKLAEASEIMKELRGMEGQLDKELLDKYKKIRASKRPVFVPFRAPASCGGCGMDVASDIVNKLGEGRHIQECPNCGRIMYKMD